MKHRWHTPHRPHHSHPQHDRPDWTHPHPTAQRPQAGGDGKDTPRGQARGRRSKAKRCCMLQSWTAERITAWAHDWMRTHPKRPTQYDLMIETFSSRSALSRHLEHIDLDWKALLASL
jgi:hypothetical protein